MGEHSVSDEAAGLPSAQADDVREPVVDPAGEPVPGGLLSGGLLLTGGLLAGPFSGGLFSPGPSAPGWPSGPPSGRPDAGVPAPGEPVPAVVPGEPAQGDSQPAGAEPAASEPAEPNPAEPELAEPELAEPALRSALEAILLVVDEPVGDDVLARVLEQPVARVSAALHALSEEYTAAGRGFDLRRAAGGWRLYTRPEQARYVERFVLDGQQARLSQAALETLAVIAYKQPVTRSRVSAIRGVNCDGVIRTLLTRGLVEEAGTEPETGAYLYRTTSMFLEKLGLDSLEQLPPLAPFLPDDVDALDPDARDVLASRRGDDAES